MWIKNDGMPNLIGQNTDTRPRVINFTSLAHDQACCPSVAVDHMISISVSFWESFELLSHQGG